MTMSRREAAPSDEDLVRLVRAGDAEAAARLFARYRDVLRAEVGRTVRGTVRRRVADSDVLQEAWIAAFERLDAFVDRGAGSFGRWFRQIVRHKARDAVRRHLGTAKRNAGAEVTRGSVAPAVRDGRPTPGTAAARQEEGERLRHAMTRLTPDQQQVLERVHHGGMTFVEVAEATGRTPNAVLKLYGRAVKALTRVLAEPGGDPP